MEQLQLEIGINAPVLEASFTQYGFLSMNIWIKSLWQFVLEEGIILCDKDPAVPPLQCNNDEFIMEWLLRVCNWSQGDIIKFNHCCIRMQVLTLADIIHGDGISLQQCMKSPNDGKIGESKYDWARESPSSTNCGIWWMGLKLLTSENEMLPFYE